VYSRNVVEVFEAPCTRASRLCLRRRSNLGGLMSCKNRRESSLRSAKGDIGDVCHKDSRIIAKLSLSIASESAKHNEVRNRSLFTFSSAEE